MERLKICTHVHSLANEHCFAQPCKERKRRGDQACRGGVATQPLVDIVLGKGFAGFGL